METGNDPATRKRKNSATALGTRRQRGQSPETVSHCFVPPACAPITRSSFIQTRDIFVSLRIQFLHFPAVPFCLRSRCVSPRVRYTRHLFRCCFSRQPALSFLSPIFSCFHSCYLPTACVVHALHCFHAISPCLSFFHTALILISTFPTLVFPRLWYGFSVFRTSVSLFLVSLLPPLCRNINSRSDFMVIVLSMDRDGSTY